MNDEKYSPEFEKWFRVQARETLAKLDRLPPGARARVEDEIRDRFLKFENDRAARAQKEPDFGNPSTQAKYVSLMQRLDFDLDQIAKKALDKHDERYKPEWRDFEDRFRDAMKPQLEKLDDLRDEARAEAWDKLRERYGRFEKEDHDLRDKEPDFYDPKTQGKHMSLVEFLHFDADQIAKKAVEAERAKDLAEQYKAREAAAGLDRDRER